MKKAQSELLATVALIGLALVMGVAIISLVGSTIASYRDQVLLMNTLNTEVSNTFVNLITYDNTSNRLWLLLKRLDGSRIDFFIAVAVDSQYIPCSNARYYNPVKDTDSIMCNEAEDCPAAQQFKLASPGSLYVPYEGSIVSFADFVRARNYGLSTTSSIPICIVKNVCNLVSIPGLCANNTIFVVSIPSGARVVRIFTFTLFNNNLYLVNVYEVRLS